MFPVLIAIPTLLMSASVARAAGLIYIKGIVTDSITGEQLPFANIINTSNGRYNKVADENGQFTLNTSSPNWIASYSGYKDKSIPLVATDTIINLRLSPLETALDEIVVRPKKEKYSKKNNPAVDFVNRLRKTAKEYDPKNEPYYSFDKYEKMLLGINDFKSEFNSGFLGKKGKFLENYVDTSSWTGKRILDLIIKEKSSTQIFSQSPKANKEVLRGYRSAGLDEVITEENMQVLLEDAIREVDIYGNDIVFLQNRFVSPLSSIGPDFYKYYLADTVYVDNTKCIELDFLPRNDESMGFNGRIYVPVGDTTMFVKKVTMRVPQHINLNYVDNIFINQSFEKDSLGNRHKTYDDVCIELQLAPGSPHFYGRKTTVYDNFSYKKHDDFAEFYTRLGNDIELEGARSQGNAFWADQRMVPLTVAEARMEKLMPEMRKVPILYWAEKVISLMESGYIATGKQSKFDIGPINTFLSFNTVEGARLRAGGMTMAPLNPHLFAKGYVAYGTRDKVWKYSADIEYSFEKKKRHSFQWPRHGFFASYSYDLDFIGQHYSSTNKDNIFLSLKRMESILATYKREVSGGYILELRNNFSVEAMVRREEQHSTKWVPFKFADGRSDSKFTQASMNIKLRYAPGEKFVQGRTQRLPVNRDAWIFQLTHEYGPKGFLGADFPLNRTELSIQKRLWLSAFGHADIILKGGKVWSGVYYPALLWPDANLSYTIQDQSYSLMNPMEFANDQYASLDIAYYGNGILFNRIPFIKRYKLRESFSFKALMGNLSDKNNPALNQNLYMFPADALAMKMRKTPYMEIGVGIDNILSFLRVDYVWRLTYLDNPGIDKNGVRVSLHFSF